MTLLVKLLFRNAFRHKLRTFLTIAGITIAVLAFGILRTVANAWYVGVEASSANRLITRNAISLIFPLPISYAEKIRQVRGVSQVSYGNWFGGVYIEEKNFFPNFAVEPKTYLEIVPELILTEDEKLQFLKDRKGAVAGIKTAERFGWKTGDLITLRGTIFPGNWDFVLRGIYKGRDETTDETLFIFHWDYLNERLKQTEPRRSGQTGFFFVKIDDPNMAAEVSGAVDALFKNSLAETLTETEKAFQMSFVVMTEAIMLAIQLISIVVIFIIMAVMANTMAMSVRERLGEYAVMKTLGFGPRHLALLITGESFTITAAGTVLGIALTFPAAKVFSSQLGAFFPIFLIKPQTIYLDIIAAMAVAGVAAVIPAYRAVKIPIISALRRVG